jgi:hypothetical protein
MNKEELVDNIKEWIQIDNELKELQKAARERRERKKELTNNLVNVMRDNEIDCFDVNDGKLIYTKSKVKETMSKKYLLNTLQTFYQNDPVKAKELSEFIMNNRQEKVKENIRRKIT